MRRTRIVELDEDRDIRCPICKTVIIGDEGLTQQPSCPPVSFVYANGGCFEYDPEGLQERLDAAQEKANEEGDYFDAWDWLSAHCDKRDVFLERSSESVACGQVSFKVWIGIRTESGYGTDKDEFSSKDHRMFFQPTPKFVRWMKTNHSGRHVYEVGCGVGNTASMLAKAGLHVTAIDLEPRSDSEFDAIKADSTEYQFEKGSVVLICSPCHNRFVVRTLTRAILCGVAEIVYVGLTKNLEGDLGSLHDRFTKRRVGVVGHSGERVWELNVKHLRAEASMRRCTIPRLSSSYSQ